MQAEIRQKVIDRQTMRCIRRLHRSMVVDHNESAFIISWGKPLFANMMSELRVSTDAQTIDLQSWY
jgi:aromatic ring-cleaving dioxygenase